MAFHHCHFLQRRNVPDVTAPELSLLCRPITLMSGHTCLSATGEVRPPAPILQDQLKEGEAAATDELQGNRDPLLERHHLGSVMVVEFLQNFCKATSFG